MVGNAAKIAGTAITITDVVGNLAAFGSKALPVALFVASFIPALAPAAAAISIAAPYITRVAAAAPAVHKAIENGLPIFEAIEQHGPSLVADLKRIYAAAVNADPARPETDLTVADVSTEEAVFFAGPILLGRRWTHEEEQRWFDRATAGVDK